jgi:hypothetical protein
VLAAVLCEERRAYDLHAFLGEGLARDKIPRGFTFTSQSLREDADKVRRSAVRALLAVHYSD